MIRRNNYLIQAAQAKERFLTYDQNALIAKFGLKFDDDYLYVNLLRQSYRISRGTGDMEKQADNTWQEANTYHEVMTILDLLCDSRDDRFISGRWQSMQTFGQMFHRELLERRDPAADRIEADPEGFRRACLALGGQPVSGCDMGYSLELFDGLPIALQFWHGDDEFYPRLRCLWDANALQYIRYETMYFAVNLVTDRILEMM